MFLVVFLPEFLRLIRGSSLQTVVVVVLNSQNIHPVVLHLVLALMVVGHIALLPLVILR